MNNKEYNIQLQYRSAWFVVVVVSLIFAVYITLLGWAEFNDNPTFTTLYSQKYPIWEVDFPGVTLCSINRLSRKAANEYAEKLLVNLTYNLLIILYNFPLQTLELQKIHNLTFHGY